MIVYKHKNISDLKESELVEFLITNFGQFFYKSIRIQSSTNQFFSYEYFPGIIGDLDLLLVDPNKPQHSIEFEFKKIKLKDKADLSEIMNKLGGLKKVIHQINNRLEIGFFKVYLGILIVKQIGNNYKEKVIFRRASLKSLNKIENSEYLKKLDKRTGIIFFQLNQPMGENFYECCGLTIEVLREAKPQIQPLHLTDTISKLFC